MQRHALVDGPLGFLALAHDQIGLAVEVIHALVIDAGELWAQQVVDAPVAKAAPHICNLHEILTQILCALIGLRWKAATVPGEPHKSARVAFG